MRVGVISDTHGSYLHLVDYIRELGFHKIIHLGDFAGDGKELEKLTGVELISVRGNCDYKSEEPYERVVELEGVRIFLSHGHKYSVNMGVNNLFYRAKELDCQLSLFGHTHIPFREEVEGVTILNPGSASYPRGTSQAGILILDLENGKVSIKNKKV